MAEDKDEGHLLRVLGVAFGVAVVIGGVIGQGILRTPGLVAQGTASPILIIGLWILGGVIAWIDAMSTVELASSIRKTGGPYSFAVRAFGPIPGLAVGIADWLANVGAIAFVAVVFGEYLHRLGIGTSLPIGALAVAMVLIIGTIHWFGTKVGGRSQEIGSAVKAVLFLGLVVVLMMSPKGAPVQNLSLTQITTGLTLSGVVVALRGIFGSYYGWNSAAYFCEEVRDPGKAIAKATFSGIALVTVIYVLVNVAFLKVLTPAEMAGSNLVAADAAARVFGSAGDTIVTAVSLISLVTVANATIMIIPRVLFAVARDAGVHPLSHVVPNGTPRVALILTVVAGALLATGGVYDLLLAFSASLLAALGVAVNLAAIVMRVREPDLERPWRMPFFPVPAIIALVLNLALLVVFVQEDRFTAAQAFGLLAVLTAVAYVLTWRTARV